MNDSVLGRYWKAYGGFKALFTSQYFYSAIVISGALYPLWIEKPSHDLIITIMPSLLGFSLGGYALLLAIGDEDFRAMISGTDESGEPSPYMEVNSTFVHFILMQFLSLVVALFSLAYHKPLDPSGWVAKLVTKQNIPIDWIALGARFIIFDLFVYALLTALAATFAIFRVSSWYDLKCEASKSRRNSELGLRVHQLCRCTEEIRYGKVSHLYDWSVPRLCKNFPAKIAAC